MSEGSEGRRRAAARTGDRRGAMKGPERARTVREFRAAVNMTRHELSEWLDTDESHEVGWRRSPGEESVGHQSGRWIVSILGKRSADLTDVDLRHMRTVIGYVHRHLAQRPIKNVSTSRWAYSLRNWGHDPAKPSPPCQGDGSEL